MKNLIYISHSFLRKEINATIVLFLEYQKEWDNKEIDFKLNTDHLEISLYGSDPQWTTRIESELLLNHLKYHYTPLIISADTGIGEGMIEPLFKR